MLRVGIVGVGAIGRAIAKAMDAGIPGAELVGLTGRDLKKVQAFVQTLYRPAPVLSLDRLIEASDLVIEAAGQAVLEEIAPMTLKQGKDLMVLSVGALLGRDEWIALARERGATLYVPSGAIVGLDGVKGARIGRIEKVGMVTRKHPRSLQGAPYLAEHDIDLSRLSQERVVFQGSARDACKGFPANINVSAALSLAGVGPDRTEVTIVADPSVKHNIHDIEVIGEFGRLHARIENVPTENPRTGKLAAFSAIALLTELTGPLRVGT